MFLEYVRNMRMVWIAGRMGGGKTALAVALAEWLISRQLALRVVSNIELIGFGPEVARFDEAQVHACTDAVILMDEAWMELGDGLSKDSARTWIANLRHRRQYLLLPSVLDLMTACEKFIVERVWNGPAFGLPVWIYEYQLGKGKRQERGKYWWWHPRAIFKRYDHLGEPSYWRLYEP